MAETIHMFELPVEIEPFSPRVERWPALVSEIAVSAAVVAFRARIASAFAKLFEDFSRPPVEMGVNDTHSANYKDRTQLEVKETQF